MARTDLKRYAEYAKRRRTLVEKMRADARRTKTPASEAVLQVIARLPRERFMGRSYREHAYEDHPQPIGLGQTLSQPAVVVWMTTLLSLTGEESILEIGTGSGYQTLVLSELEPRGTVTTIERLAIHARRARRRLRALGAANVTVITGDGSVGYLPGAPYDRILVTAGAPLIPDKLIDQLAPGGILVAPIGTRDMQSLYCVRLAPDGGRTIVNRGRCAFVPLIGVEGWKEG